MHEFLSSLEGFVLFLARFTREVSRAYHILLDCHLHSLRNIRFTYIYHFFPSLILSIILCFSFLRFLLRMGLGILLESP